MSIPPVLIGALGGAVATSMIWVGTRAAEPTLTAPQVVDQQEREATRRADRPVVTAVTDWSPQFSSDEHRSEISSDRAARLNRFQRPPAAPLGTLAQATLRSDASIPPTPPTREQLRERAIQVEEHANAELEALALRLNLTEDQQDRIFPILASSAPAYHPILRPEGGNPVYGDGISVSPGAPVAEVENEIFPELDEFQQAAVAEEAMDREAWWEDIVGQLESDLEDSTSPDLIAGDSGGNSQPEQEFTDEEREEAAATNEATDFSHLFGN